MAIIFSYVQIIFQVTCAMQICELQNGSMLQSEHNTL